MFAREGDNGETLIEFVDAKWAELFDVFQKWVTGWAVKDAWLYDEELFILAFELADNPLRCVGEVGRIEEEQTSLYRPKYALFLHVACIVRSQ